MSTASRNQQLILAAIQQHFNQHAYPPTIRELCAATGIKSTSCVHRHLAELEAQGHLVKQAAKKRSVTLAKSKSASVFAPLIGRVPAGQPVLAEENYEDTLAVPEFLTAGADSAELFLLRVHGESMIEAGILPDDVLVVQRAQTAENGEIVVAMLEGQATVKRFFRTAKHIRLQPENHTMAPIIAQDVQIIGRVTGVMRAL